jgi:hypothetical protein
MAYICDLNTGQRIYLDNQRGQTIVTLTSSSAGQQQQSSNSFTTGRWNASPEIFQTPYGIVIKIYGESGENLISVQGSSIGVMSESPSLTPSQQLQTRQVQSQNLSMPSMKPLEPMKPMQMGNMQMNMNPMEMRMGNMEMRLGGSTGETRRFCSQCGASVKVDDRFCSSCGYNLQG